MKWVSLLMPVGGMFWVLAYVLLIRLGIKNKTYTMPLVPVFCNTSWEFMYSVIYPSSFLPAKIFNFTWFVLDLALMALVFRYSKYSARSLMITLILIFSLCLLSFKGTQFLIEQNIIKNPINGLFDGFVLAIIIPLALIYTLKSNPRGHSKTIAWFMLLGTTFYALEILFNPAHTKYNDSLLIIMAIVSVLSFCLYIYKLYKTL